MREIRIVAPGEPQPSTSDGWTLDIVQTARDARAGHLHETWTRERADAEREFDAALQHDRSRPGFIDGTPKRGRGQPRIKLLTLPHLIAGLENLAHLEQMSLVQDLMILRNPGDAAWIERLQIGVGGDDAAEIAALNQPDQRVAQRQTTPARAYGVARSLEHLRTLCGLVGDPEDGALDAAALLAYLVAPVLEDAQREWQEDARRLEATATLAWNKALQRWDDEQPYQRLFEVWQHDAALLLHQRRRPAGGAVAWALEVVMLAGALPSDLETPPELAALDLLTPSLKRLERNDGSLPFTAEEIADLPSRCAMEETDEETGKSLHTFATPQMVKRSANRDAREPLRKAVDERLRLLPSLIKPEMDARLERLRAAIF